MVEKSGNSIRGLEATSVEDAVHKFEAVAERLVDHKVTLTEVVRIPSESDLFRGKVADDNTRKLILEKCKQLKDSSRYGNVFIRRDLTYKQRQELKARRGLSDISSRPSGSQRRPPNISDQGDPNTQRPAPQNNAPETGSGATAQNQAPGTQNEGTTTAPETLGNAPGTVPEHPPNSETLNA